MNYLAWMHSALVKAAGDVPVLQVDPTPEGVVHRTVVGLVARLLNK